MTSDKKPEAVRVLLYTVIACGLCYGLFAAVPDEQQTSLAMFTPLTAAILTRIITKDKPRDAKDLLLGLELKGKLRYYLYAIGFGILLNLIGAALCAAWFYGRYDLAEQLSSENARTALKALPFSICASVYLVFICFGEEYGWRAYLTPKLEKLMPDRAALIVQGIIWGMWHKPVLDMGLNFGRETPLFPWLNYALMCISCIFIGTFLTRLTKKTGSIYPAALCHSAIDLCNIMLSIVIPADLPKNDPSVNLPVGVLLMIPFPMITAVICLVMTAREKKHSEAVT